MRNAYWAGWVVLGLIGASSCTTQITTGGGGGSGCLAHDPAKHRSAPATCPASTPATPCTADSDCTASNAAPPGKCSAAGVCDFNECTTDADCTDPTKPVCSCEGQTSGFGGQSSGSVCIPGNCHTDTDCGAGGFCSPTVSSYCGGFYGTQGFYCHTCDDSCIDDADCVSESGPGYCAFDPTVGHWACGTGFCAG